MIGEFYPDMPVPDDAYRPELVSRGSERCVDGGDDCSRVPRPQADAMTPVPFVPVLPENNVPDDKVPFAVELQSVVAQIEATADTQSAAAEKQRMRGEKLLQDMTADAQLFAREYARLGLSWQSVNIHRTETQQVPRWYGTQEVTTNTADFIPVAFVLSGGDKDLDGKKLSTLTLTETRRGVTTRKVVDPKRYDNPVNRDRCAHTDRFHYEENSVAVSHAGAIIVEHREDTSTSFPEGALHFDGYDYVYRAKEAEPADLFDVAGLTEAKARQIHERWRGQLTSELQEAARLRQGGVSAGGSAQEITARSRFEARTSTKFNRRGTAALIAPVAAAVIAAGFMLSDNGRSGGEAAAGHTAVTAMEDACYKDPVIPAEVVRHADTYIVERDAERVAVVGPEKTVVIRPGVHVGEVAVCGALMGLTVEQGASVGRAGVFTPSSYAELVGSVESFAYYDQYNRPTLSNPHGATALYKDGVYIASTR